jgi:hypothetical protein
MSDPRQERLAANEAVFRVANERMAEWEERHDERASELYYCECSNPDCTEQVRLSKAEYESVRSDPCHFLLIAGHQIPDIEEVVERHDGWYVVEKGEEVAEIVRATDPRRADRPDT